MKNAAKILATFAIMFFLAGEVEAAENDFVEMRRFIPTIKIPHRSEKTPPKFYTPRLPVRPKPRYIPSKPKRPSRDIRGGKIKIFTPPQTPFK